MEVPTLVFFCMWITCVASYSNYSMVNTCGAEKELQDEAMTALIFYNRETLPSAECVTTFTHENEDLIACIAPLNLTINDCQFLLLIDDDETFTCGDTAHGRFCSEDNGIKVIVKRGNTYTDAKFDLKLYFMVKADDKETSIWTWLGGAISGAVAAFVLLVIGIVMLVSCCVFRSQEKRRRANIGRVTYAVPSTNNQGGFAPPQGSYPTSQLSSGFSGTTQQTGVNNQSYFTQQYGSAFNSPNDMKQKYGIDNPSMTT